MLGNEPVIKDKQIHEMNFNELLQLMSVNQQLSNLVSFKDKLLAIEAKTLSSRDSNKLYKIVSSNPAIDKLTSEEVKEIFDGDDPITLNLLHEDSDEEAIEKARREVLGLKMNIVSADDTISYISELVNESIIEEIIDNQFNIISLIESYISKVTDDKISDSMKKLLEINKRSLSLDSLINLYSGLRKANQLHDYKVGTEIDNKYIKIINDFGTKADVGAFKDFETKYLPEKYHEYPGLFFFLIKKFIVYRKKEELSEYMLFNTCITEYIRRLYIDTLDEDTKNTLLSNAMRLLDTIYDG